MRQQWPPTEYESSALEKRFIRRVSIVVRMTIASVLFIAVFIYSAQVFILVFLGVLFAVFLRALSSLISKYTYLSGRWSLAFVTLALAALIVSIIWLLAPQISSQLDEMSQKLAQATQKIQTQVEKSQWLPKLLGQDSPTRRLSLPSVGTMFTRVTGLVSTTLGTIGSLIVVLFIGLFLAVNPQTYIQGLTRLAPRHRRARVHQVIDALGSTLKWWLVGRGFSMAVTGVLTALGLWILQIPLAITLGLIAAVLTFVPYVGPLIAAVPAILLGLLQGSQQALYVAVLYLGVQTVESYILTPLVQKKTVSLPPAVTLTSQMLLGVLFGTLGVIVATPLTAVAMVLTQKLYVEDSLEASDFNKAA